MRQSLPVLWAALTTSERAMLWTTFGARQIVALIKLRAALRPLRLAQREVTTTTGERLRFARWLVQTGRMTDGPREIR